ncbi:peroxide stress protein YaaA [Microbacterium sp. 4R-513]|uniref:YaaA family protein n=1 Tax=Microbacterium sp. 4R-513 TaxID=2567934 RepID=UPI0013E197AD|nr:peroxide stress protein YaaA [Microbacterium sp. 4R-513]QIG38193.1 peroxide stress protein YaaA [Microbacterium sp. 4R-513]
MLILLPPSETKRPGGSGRPLDLDGLALPGLTPQREQVLTALEHLATDAEASARVLKLGATQRHEIDHNARVRTTPAIPAVDRYTGVLYDALDAASLDPAGRSWLGRHVLIHSAPLGPVGALDRIPVYRLGASTSLPGVPPLRRLWAGAVTYALAEAGAPFVLDLRSEAYAALGPVPATLASAYVRVVAEGEGGAVRALNHFNKHAKGALVRRLAVERPRIRSREGFLRWADAAGLRARPGRGQELELFA